jgi:ribosomal protein L29
MRAREQSDAEIRTMTLEDIQEELLSLKPDIIATRNNLSVRKAWAQHDDTLESKEYQKNRAKTLSHLRIVENRQAQLNAELKRRRRANAPDRD